MKNFLLLFLIMLFFSFIDAHAQFTDAQKAGLNSENVFPNGGGESGKVNWSANGGTSTVSADTTDKLSGKASIKFTSSGATDYLATAATAIKHTPNCMLDFWYKTSSATAIADVMDGANVIATLSLPSSASTYTNANISFVCNQGTQYHMHVRGLANAEIIKVDDFYEGKNLNIGSVNLADKQYDLTVTGLSGDNSWSTIRGVAIPYKTRDGVWRIKINIEGTSSTVANVTLTLTGVTFKNVSLAYQALALFPVGSNGKGRARATNNSSNIYMEAGGDTIGQWGVSGDVELESKPTWATDFPSEQVVRAEAANQFAAALWTNGLSGSSSYTVLSSINISGADALRTNYGKATNSSTANDIAIKITSLPVGKYLVTANGAFFSETSTGSDTSCVWGFGDGTTNVMTSTGRFIDGKRGTISEVKAYFEYTSMGDRTFTLKTVREFGNGACSFSNLGQTQLMLTVIPVNQVSSVQVLSGTVLTDGYVMTTIAAANVGQSGNQGATCSSGTCGIFQEIGTGISSVVYSSTGTYTVNFNSGAFNQSPICTCSAKSGAGSDRICTFVVNSNTSGTIITRDSSTGNPTNGNPSIICVGTR